MVAIKNARTAASQLFVKHSSSQAARPTRSVTQGCDISIIVIIFEFVTVLVDIVLFTLHICRYIARYSGLLCCAIISCIADLIWRWNVFGIIAMYPFT